MSEQNENGLTYARWEAAATFGATKKAPSLAVLRAAWRNGECPCDWAASLA